MQAHPPEAAEANHVGELVRTLCDDRFAQYAAHPRGAITPDSSQ